MAKRELIDKSEVMMFVDDVFECQCNEKEAYELLDSVPTFTEQEIVKPYLEELKSKMKERDDDNGGEPLNAVDRGYHLAYEHLCKEIDNLLSEQGEQTDEKTD